MTCRASIVLVSICLLSGLPAAVAQEPPDASALVQKGRRLVADGDFAEGLALYEQALAAQPGLADAHLATGIVLDLMGRYADARKHLTQAIEQAPPELKANTLNAMATSYAFERRTADAAAFFQQVYDLEQGAGRPAGAAAAANALGRLYLETGDLKKARQWYQTGYEMSRRQPDEPASQLALWELRWLHAQGRIAARAGDAATARRHLDAARQLVAADARAERRRAHGGVPRRVRRALHRRRRHGPGRAVQGRPARPLQPDAAGRSRRESRRQGRRQELLGGRS